MENENRRRTIVVNQGSQKRIVVATTWAPVLCLLLTAVLLGHYSSQASQESGIVPFLLLAFLLISAALLVFNALSFSHRVAGPAHHFGKVLHAVRQGDLEARIHLRRGDFLTTVADEINDFLEWLQEHPPQGVTPQPTSDSSEAPEPVPAAKE